MKGSFVLFIANKNIGYYNDKAMFSGNKSNFESIKYYYQQFESIVT